MCLWLSSSAIVLLFLIGSGSSALGQGKDQGKPHITIASAPTNAPGNFFADDNIKGTVSGVKPGQCRVVVFAFDADGQNWWVQPDTNALIGINANGEWETPTRGGYKFAALLVSASYILPTNNPMRTVPSSGGDVYDVAYIKGATKKQ